MHLSAERITAYNNWTAQRWVDPLLPLTTHRLDHLIVMTFGLSGEAAEVAEVVAEWATTGKRPLRNLIKELGDTIYYWGRLCEELAVPPPAASASKLPAELLPPVVEALLLNTAAGKVSEIVKKYLRDGTLNKELLVAGLNACFHSWQLLCEHSGLTCEEVLAANEIKIEGRVERGTQRGSGDDR